MATAEAIYQDALAVYNAAKAQLTGAAIPPAALDERARLEKAKRDAWQAFLAAKAAFDANISTQVDVKMPYRKAIEHLGIVKAQRAEVIRKAREIFAQTRKIEASGCKPLNEPIVLWEETGTCGFVPPTPGYAPCTRAGGHEGPCAHPLA